MTILVTKRLAILNLNTDDAPFILDLLNDSDWLRFIGDKGVKTIEDACRYIQDGPITSYKKFGFGLYLIRLKDINTPIGLCGLIKRDYLDHADLGFALLPQFRGKGYITECSSAILDFAEDRFGFKKILAIAKPDNVNSIKALNKLGFTFKRMIKTPLDEAEIKLFSITL